MISRWLVLVLCVVVFSPDLLHAQQQSSSLPQLFSGAAATDSTNYDKMYEDIEILRRILDRKFTPLYPEKTNYTIMTNSGEKTVVIPMRTSEGVYLKGQGVVYTATLSSLQPSAKAEAGGSTKGEFLVLRVGSDSEWERARRQVRNEKEEPKKPEASKPPTLSDVLLKVLAENGHHFSQLGANESLTLVITVHDTNPSSRIGKSAGGSGPGGSAKTRSQAPSTVIGPPPGERTVIGAALEAKVRNLELLGDLHMKQEYYNSARDAFREAIELKPGRERMAVLARKLAQAYLMLSKVEEARGALDQAITLMKEDTDAKDKPAAAAKPAPALPVKLIVSAPKKLLDEAKGGKISFEEFRRRARVETLRFDDHRSHK